VTRSRIAALAVAATALISQQAHAAVVPLGPGADPAVVVDPSTGALHALYADAPAGAALRYCQVPKGLTACAARSDLPSGGAAVGAPALLRDERGNLTALGALGSGATLAWPTVTNGSRWTGPFAVSAADAGGARGAAALGPLPGEASVGGLGPAGAQVTSLRLDGGAPAGGAGPVTLPGAPAAAPVLTRAPGGAVLAAAAGSAGVLVWQRTGGAWSAPSLVAPGEDAPRLAADAGGAWLLTRGPGGPLLRRWAQGTAFAPPVRVAAEAAGDLALAAAGPAVAVAWTTPGAVRAAVSADRGGTFPAPRTVAPQPGAGALRAGVAEDGSGFALWRAPDGVLRAAPLEEPGPASRPPTGEPQPGATAVRRVTRRVGRATLTLSVPRACVRPGARFTARLSVRRGPRARRAAFAVGSARVGVDRRAPFARTLRLPAVTRPGARAGVSVRVALGGRTVTLRAPVRACP
jgi:hypothetical protein